MKLLDFKKLNLQELIDLVPFEVLTNSNAGQLVTSINPHQVMDGVMQIHISQLSSIMVRKVPVCLLKIS